LAVLALGANYLDRIPLFMQRKDAPYPEAGGTIRPIFIALQMVVGAISAKPGIL
jgi:hypothetical protein